MLVAILIQSFFIKAFIIPSSSMSPTLQIGDRVMVDRVTYYFRKPRRGDVIVFRYPPTAPQATNTTNPLYWPFEQIGETLHITHRTSSSPFVKRVIATEGETMEIKKVKSISMENQSRKTIRCLIRMICRQPRYRRASCFAWGTTDRIRGTAGIGARYRLEASSERCS